MNSSATERRRFALALLLGLLLAVAAPARADDAAGALAPERVVLRTTAGDLLLAFHPGLAPVSVKQVEDLAASGAYDGAALTYLQPGFVAQFSVDDAALAAPRLKAERSPAMRHRRGTVSLAHDPADADSGKASLFIALDDRPDLDGQYTVVGEVVDGFATLSALEATAADADGTPLTPVTVTRASLLKTPAERFLLSLSNGRPPDVAAAAAATAPASELTNLMLASLASVVVLVLLGLALKPWLGERAVQACLVGTALVATPAILSYVTPRVAGKGVLATSVVVGILVLLRLLGRFEGGALGKPKPG